MARRFRPVYGVFFLLLFGGGVLVADYAIDTGFGRDYQTVRPGTDRQIRLDVSELDRNEVRFFRFLNEGNQEIKFLVGRDEAGHVQTAFDANEVCYKKGRGYVAQDGWLVCQWCEKSFRLVETAAGGGGCRPVPIPHRVAGDELVIAETDMLAGWRFFR